MKAVSEVNKGHEGIISSLHFTHDIDYQLKMKLNCIPIGYNHSKNYKMKTLNNAYFILQSENHADSVSQPC